MRKKWRIISKNTHSQIIMKAGASRVAMSSKESRVFSPMRNTDINPNDWSELLKKAMIQTIRFRNEFYR
jgi:hypothetical protein